MYLRRNRPPTRSCWRCRISSPHHTSEVVHRRQYWRWDARRSAAWTSMISLAAVHEHTSKTLAAESGPAATERAAVRTQRTAAAVAGQERESRSTADGADSRSAVVDTARSIGHVPRSRHAVPKTRALGRREPGVPAADAWQRWRHPPGLRGGG